MLVSGDIVPKQVIHAWCCVLNKCETIRAHTSPSRLYLPLSSEVSSQIDDNFTGASLIFVPIVSEKPFAMCFNFLTKKLEILHLMRPEMVNFAPSIEPTKDFVIKCLLKKMPSIVAVRDMKPEEIILRSNLGNGSDSGIYLMRLLEKYKGERRTCVLGLQDNNQVKVFGTRACYELLSFAGNQDF
ncbi:uncharacterized protein LOC141651562 [Silene latifolia]|uniref:uncharacterized protein LOC141651562 n=1 Tax=Silene latifolia TaxID=37657 RepID=UPI003D78AE0E